MRSWLLAVCSWWCERCEAKRSEFAVKTFFLQLYGTFKQREILETFNFYMLLKEQELSLFDRIIYIRDEQDRLGPAMMLLTGYSSV